MNKQNFWLVGAGAVITVATGVAVIVHAIRSKKQTKETEKDLEPVGMLNGKKPEGFENKDKDLDEAIKQAREKFEKKVYSDMAKLYKEGVVPAVEVKDDRGPRPITKSTYSSDIFEDYHFCEWNPNDKKLYDMDGDVELGSDYEELVDAMWKDETKESQTVDAVYFAEGSTAYEAVMVEDETEDNES